MQDLLKSFVPFGQKELWHNVAKTLISKKNAVFGPNLKIGNNSGVGINCEVYGPVSIGDNVMMGPEVVVYTSGHKHDRTDIPMSD